MIINPIAQGDYSPHPSKVNTPAQTAAPNNKDSGKTETQSAFNQAAAIFNLNAAQSNLSAVNTERANLQQSRNRVAELYNAMTFQNISAGDKGTMTSM